MKFLSQQLQQAKIDQLVGAGADGIAQSHQEELSKYVPVNMLPVRMVCTSGAQSSSSPRRVICRVSYTAGQEDAPVVLMVIIGTCITKPCPLTVERPPSSRASSSGHAPLRS